MKDLAKIKEQLEPPLVELSDRISEIDHALRQPASKDFELIWALTANAHPVAIISRTNA